MEPLTLRGAANGSVYAATADVGTPQLRVLDDATLKTRAVLPLRDTPFIYQSGFLYTAQSLPITETAPLLQAINVTAVARPALVGALAPPWRGALDWASVPGALYVLAGAPDEAIDLHILSLADPAHPQWVGAVQNIGRTRILAHGNWLYAADAQGLAIYDIRTPRTPLRLSANEWWSDAQIVDADLAMTGHYIYFMGSSGPLREPFCRIIDVQTPEEPILGGECPFRPHKSTFTPGFVYVNPNISSAEYLDYEIYSIAQPSAPRRVGTTMQHWRTAFNATGGMVVQDFRGHILRLKQLADGTLQVSTSTWSADDLNAAGPVRAQIGNVALVDGGAPATGSGRVLRMLDLSNRSGPVLRGAFTSPWLGTQRIVVDGARMLALRNSRLTLFDMHNPAQPEQLGQFVSPIAESLEHLLLGAPGFAYLVGSQNTLLTVDTSTATTPTLASLVKLPGSTSVALVAKSVLYLFGEDELLLVDATSPGQPMLLRSLPVQTPDAATLWGQTLYLITKGALQVLDVSVPAQPRLVTQIEPPAGMKFAPQCEAHNGRLALQILDAPGPTPMAQPPAYLIYDLEAPFAPRLIATLPGVYPDAFFDGDRLYLPGPRVFTIGPRTVVRAPLSSEGAAIPIGADAQSGVVITYTLPVPSAGAGIFATPAQTACLRHEGDIANSWLPPLHTATYAGPFILSLVNCATDEPIPISTPITLALTLPEGDVPPVIWSAAGLYADNGNAWLPITNAQHTGSTWTATVEPPLVWGVRGPAPDPVHLPIIAR